MTQVLRSPSHLPSPPTPPLPRVPSRGDVEIHAAPSSSVDGDLTLVDIEDGEAGKGEQRDRDEVPLLALLVTLLRKSWVACHNTDREELSSTMEIGSPTNVRHVAHVTFDRFNGFLGLPDEFEPDVPRRPPSASASVFGVSTDSMQLSFDSRGNSVPTILLLMQNRLYSQGGLQVEGIFRINAENSQEEYVRDQLNRGVLPDVLHVHCLAGLLKAWFRELPTGVLDSLSSEQVMQSQTEEECARLVHLLPPTEAALLNWAVNLMADVAQFEHVNKMNARNIAMVFAPNMTHMADPLTALMHAVHVMNFLKTLIVQTLEERNGFVMEPPAVSHGGPSDDNGHHGSSQPFESVSEVGDEESSEDQFLAVEESASLSLDHSPEAGSKRESEGVDMANGILEVTGSVVVKNLGHKAGPGPLGLVLESKYKGEGKQNIIRLVRFPRTDRVEAWR